MVLITYDVNTTKPSGCKRLKKIAKVCCNYGQRVQNSVFECSLTPAQLVMLSLKFWELLTKMKTAYEFITSETIIIAK